MNAEISYLQEHMVPWLDAFIASRHNNNTQWVNICIYIYIYIYIFGSPVICVFETSKE